MSSKRIYESGSKKRKAKVKKAENLNLMRGSMNKFLRKTNISENEAFTDQRSETVILDLLSENDFENNLNMQKDNVNENNIELNSGNFIRAVRLLAEFDPVLNSLLLTEQSRVKYLSWKIQNELIEILATNLQQLICEEIRSAQCFSIIIDSTQDITKIDQVSFIFRYTIVDYKESKLMQGPRLCGASVISGCFSGVQKRISDIIPNASFVHCAAHNFNLVSNAPSWATLALGDDVAKIVLKKTQTCVTVGAYQTPVNNIKKRKVFSKKFFGDLDGDKRYDIAQDNLKVKFFLPVIDTALVQLKYRFLGLQEVVDKLIMIR
ncbi:uncharacterized protein LOC111038579 [Myzus persicae]|uniref:uncharacterized protein LOC111038579 n=1 Tax=Myzus persicae TaxID=13164 RepID=UPI000B937153|nr:uncharacterized protein LOC111038579 [Myzus persicae]